MRLVRSDDNTASPMFVEATSASSQKLSNDEHSPWYNRYLESAPWSEPFQLLPKLNVDHVLVSSGTQTFSQLRSTVRADEFSGQ